MRGKSPLSFVSQVAQKMSHVVSKKEPSGISLFDISDDTIYLIG
jgi:hypothetical protein